MLLGRAMMWRVWPNCATLQADGTLQFFAANQSVCFNQCNASIFTKNGIHPGLC